MEHPFHPPSALTWEPGDGGGDGGRPQTNDDDDYEINALNRNASLLSFITVEKRSWVIKAGPKDFSLFYLWLAMETKSNIEAMIHVCSVSSPDPEQIHHDVS
ncbi:hypothetical protein ACROYT_G037249 [Oculina patagonica]